SNYCHETIETTHEFVVNVCGEGQLRAIGPSRTLSGRDASDKIARLGLETRPARRVAAPLIVGCHANLECRVRSSSPTDGVSLYVADVLACHVDDSVPPVARFVGKTFRLDSPIE